jgi:hypothetical protein
MRCFFFAALLSLFAVISAASTLPGDGARTRMLASRAVPERQQELTTLEKLASPGRYANACGLCSDVDCCGGAENGWKLCSSDCPSGQYKCEQVAVCD